MPERRREEYVHHVADRGGKPGGGVNGVEEIMWKEVFPLASRLDFVSARLFCFWDQAEWTITCLTNNPVMAGKRNRQNSGHSPLLVYPVWAI